MIRTLWISLFLIILAWSAIAPKDYVTWFLEVLPALIGATILGITYRRFPLTPLLYSLILMHSIVLMVGGHYTYAEVPWFDHLFGSERNNYDKLGHFFQGFVPALIARELLTRLNVIEGRAWLHFIVVCICLAISAFYELIEWWVAIISQQAAEAFLGTQGYVWDTQSDMAFALIGALCAILLLSHYHDQQLRKLAAP